MCGLRAGRNGSLQWMQDVQEQSLQEETVTQYRERNQEVEIKERTSNLKQFTGEKKYFIVMDPL